MNGSTVTGSEALSVDIERSMATGYWGLWEMPMSEDGVLSTDTDIGRICIESF